MRRLNFILLLVLLSLNSWSQTLNIATYNIRNKNDGDKAAGNGWDQRLKIISQLIRFHDFDIFGSQEVLNSQLIDFQNALPEYGFVGVGRDDGKEKGEYAPIFYKKDLFKLEKSGNFWLSETPEIPSKGWDAALPRICTWAKFKYFKNKTSFWVFNLHMDHIGVQARVNSAAFVLEKIKNMCGNDRVILTGDFNIGQDNPAYFKIADSQVLFDCYNKADVRYALNGTFNNFNPEFKSEKRIDHIFVSSGWNVKKYGILTDSYRTDKSDASLKPNEDGLISSIIRLPSDHYPVMVTLKF